MNAIRFSILTALLLTSRLPANVGDKPVEGAEVIFDGSREMLDRKWTYWEGPGFASSLPIKWKIVDDPVDKGTVLMTDDPVAAGGKYGSADIVTKKTYRDFRLHIEFLIMKPGGNSGVYLQNRYEIQVLDGDKTKHGMGAVINEDPPRTKSTMASANGIPTTSSSARPVSRMARFPNNRCSRCFSTAPRSTRTSPSARSGAVPNPESTAATTAARASPTSQAA